MSKDKYRILSIPSAGKRAEDYVPGTSFTTHKCCGCGQWLLVAPSSQTFFETHPGTEFICAMCVDPQPGDTINPAPGALNEANEFFKKKAH